MWKDIKDFEGIYQINECGEIKNVKTNKLRRLSTKKNGYVYVDLYKNGKEKWYRVHRLVAETFIPNPNNLPSVMHLDNNKSNNFVNNLKWGTVSENTQQAYDDGLIDLCEDFILFNDDNQVECHGYKEILKLTGYKNKNTICSAIKNKSKIRFGNYKGYQIKKKQIK